MQRCVTAEKGGDEGGDGCGLALCTYKEYFGRLRKIIWIKSDRRVRMKDKREEG